jgi:hypothetical protein
MIVDLCKFISVKWKEMINYNMQCRVRSITFGNDELGRHSHIIQTDDFIALHALEFIIGM